MSSSLASDASTITTRSGPVADVFPGEAERDEALDLATESRFGAESAPAPILWSIRDVTGRTWYGFSFSAAEMPEGARWM